MCVYGALAQLVVRYIRIVEVTGSTPVCSTSQALKTMVLRAFSLPFAIYPEWISRTPMETSPIAAMETCFHVL